ncbi:hypothetical protein evm_014532 [Chilo suppressalis]|nr:hypothetical protein evm_014532 [Chilo suppressalis]
MAKEMMIVFVYDTQCCTSEEDDPVDAVLYFHPGWVSDTQRHALAGQSGGALVPSSDRSHFGDLGCGSRSTRDGRWGRRPSPSQRLHSSPSARSSPPGETREGGPVSDLRAADGLSVRG